MGILDGVVEWISEQIMHGLDLINTSVLGALGCGMDTFLRYFPAAETMYDIFTAIGIGLILLMWVWNLFKNYWLGAGFEAEHPVKLTFRAIIFITLTYCAKSIVEIVLKIGGTPYDWILTSELPPLSFADFNSVMLVIIGACANGAVTLIVLIIVVLLAWNYLKLLFEATERYILLGVLVYTAPVAFSMGGSQSTAGGVKVNAFAVVVLNLVAVLRGSERVEVFGRELSHDSIRRSNATVVMSLGVLFLFIFILSILEPKASLLALTFECVSALSTVGSSLNLTPQLCDASKLLVSLLMFIGRVGLITLMLGIVKQKKNTKYRYPSDNIIIN